MKVLLTENQYKILLTEDFKTQREKYRKQGFSYDDIDRYLKYFRNIKDKKYKELYTPIPGFDVPIERRHDIDAYIRFEDLLNIVTYVRGQVDTGDYEEKLVSSGSLVYEDDVIEIKQAFSNKMCIEYLKPFHYGWCVSKKEQNSYYGYRNNPRRPTFYFVKIKDRTNAELQRHQNGYIDSNSVIDKWHFFVLQVTKSGEYVITSATNNPGEQTVEWSTIVNIEPRMKNYKHFFVSVLDHELDIDRTEMSDEQFCREPYRSKENFLNTNVYIGLKKFGCLPLKLKQHYIDLKHELMPEQLKLIGYNPMFPLEQQITKNSLLERYKVIMNRSLKEQISSRNFTFPLHPETFNFFDDETEYLFIIGYIKKGGKLSRDQFNSSSDNIKISYISEGNQITSEMIHSFEHHPDMMKKFVFYLNASLQDKIIPKLSESIGTKKFSTTILPESLMYANEKTWEMISNYIIEQIPAVTNNQFHYFPYNIKKIYIKMYGTDINTVLLHTLRILHPDLIKYAVGVINDEFISIIGAAGHRLAPLKLNQFSVGSLTEENKKMLVNIIRNSTYSDLKIFFNKLHGQDSTVNIDQFGPMISQTYHQVFDVLKDELKKKTPVPGAPLSSHADVLSSISNDVDRALSEEHNRKLLDKIVIKINDDGPKTVAALTKFYPFLRPYYNKLTGFFTTEPEVVSKNIIESFKKSILDIEYVKYFIDVFSKHDINQLITFTNQTRPYMQSHIIKNKLENWYIKNRKKKLGINESKITLQEILNIL